MPDGEGLVKLELLPDSSQKECERRGAMVNKKPNDGDCMNAGVRRSVEGPNGKEMDQTSELRPRTRQKWRAVLGQQEGCRSKESGVGDATRGEKIGWRWRR